MNIIADESKLKKDTGASLVIEKIKDLGLDDDALVYYNFPFYRGETVEELIQAHILYVSRIFGVIAFRVFSSLSNITNSELEKVDELDSHLFGKLNKCEELRKGRRELKINVTPIIISEKAGKQNEIPIITNNEIKGVIENNKTEDLTEDEFRALIATIEGTKRLRQKKERNINPDSDKLTKGKILSLIQQEETVFDLEQKRAALNIIDSPQRIRGLAGSGKTIILTMKAALYHLQNPENLILYTYFTKALFGQVKYLIEKYYRDFSDNQEPDWTKIKILHAWGGKSLEGVYSGACLDNDIEPIQFFVAKRASPNNPFAYVCQELNKNKLKQKYDLTLIDEGQDFPSSFYQLCYKLTKNERIVWAYDDFQNIFDIQMQDEKETFGKKEDGTFYVDFSEMQNKLQDIVLHKCYRNPQKALVAAFSLGLGIYNDKILQRLGNNQHWEDLGFVVEKGDSKEGSHMIISRPDENSPMDTNKYFESKTISNKTYSSMQEECQSTVNEIINDIQKENLNPDDICVISLDERFMKVYFDSIESKLNKKGVKTFNLLNVPNNNTYFSIENHVTLSSINKAKGNEVGMVYIVGVDAAFNENNKDYIVYRNKLFTAITRTKGWVRITGTGQSASFFVKEFETLREKDFKFDFIQPSEESTRTIYVNMDESQMSLNKINKEIEALSRKTGLSIDAVIKMLNQSNAKK